MTDPLGYETTLEWDYQAMQPTLITNINGNRKAVTLDALAIVRATTAMGKDKDVGEEGGSDGTSGNGTSAGED